MSHMPEWLRTAVFYQIYPQSFRDTNADGVGDFDGIIEKLDYIRTLGCDAIWLNPCFESPFGDAGYDVADYCKAAPRYGTNDDLRRLFDEAHRRGMHVLLDLVPGHTSVKHEWFRESCRAERNEYTDRYIWTDSVWTEPDGMACIRGISERDGSCAVNFFSHQPALNYGFYRPDPKKPWQQPTDGEGPQKTLSAMMDVMRFWLSLGCDGFRVDMAGSLVKHDEDGRGTVALWKKVRAFLDCEFPDAAMISEWGEPDKSLEGGFHMDFLLHFGPSHYNDLFRCESPYFCGHGDASEFVRRYTSSLSKTEGCGLICIPSGNHDMQRLARTVTGVNAKIAFLFLLTMPGAPFIYYGDEIGMRYVEGLASVEGGYDRTGSRSPMQWGRDKNAGFGDAAPDKLYIPVDPDENRPDVEDEEVDDDSLLSEVKRQIKLRREHPALSNTGKIEFVYAEKNAYPLAYVREADGERLMVALNPSDADASFECDAAVGDIVYAIGGEPVCEHGRMTVPAMSAAVCRVM